MEEVQLQQAQWECEKQALLQQMVQAAMECIACWIHVQKFQAWQQEVQQAKAAEQ